MGSIWESISFKAKDLIQKLICLDAKSRLTAGQVLEHSWVKDAVLPTTKRAPFGLHSALQNLKSFRSQGYFKKVARTVIAGQLKENEIKELKIIFEALDTNADGTISCKELHAALVERDLDIPEDLQRIMLDLDSRGSGRINYSDFVAGALDERIYSSEEVCWNAFKFFDRNDDGSISQDELKLLLVHDELQQVRCAAKLAAMVEEIDVNSDGKIQFNEFMRMMRAAEERAD